GAFGITEENAARDEGRLSKGECSQRRQQESREDTRRAETMHRGTSVGPTNSTPRGATRNKQGEFVKRAFAIIPRWPCRPRTISCTHLTSLHRSGNQMKNPPSYREGRRSSCRLLSIGERWRGLHRGQLCVPPCRPDS